MDRSIFAFSFCFACQWIFISLAAAVNEAPWAQQANGRYGAGVGWILPSTKAVPAPTGDTPVSEVDMRRILAATFDSFERVFTDLQSSKAHARDYESQCLIDFASLFATPGENVFQVSKGMEAVDALGKPGSNILYGNLQWLGSFDECFNVVGENLMQYWVVPLNITLQPFPTVQFNLLPFRLGMCVPRSCNTSSDLAYFVKTSNDFLLNETDTYGLVADYDDVVVTRSRTIPLNAGAIAMIVVCAIFLVLAFVSSLVDVAVKGVRNLLTKPELAFLNRHHKMHGCEHYSERAPLLGQPCRDKNHRVGHRDLFSSLEKPLEFITAFSVFKNVPMILSTKQPPTAITSLNGIRVLSMFWVILAHTHYWALITGVLTNPLSLPHFISRFSFQPIANGFFSVDSFFFLSGALVAYLTLREMERKRGRFPIITYYLHRYLRLTMVYAFLLFFYWSLMGYLGNGPQWQASMGPGTPGYEQCNKYWWTNLLYINNFYPWKLGEECMGWTWYLANDMQFYVLAPLILVPLYYLFPVGLIVSGVLVLGTFAANGGISGKYDFVANTLQDANADQSDDIYIKPYCRAAPYIVGIILGFALYKKARINIHWLADWLIYCFIWFIAAGCLFSTIYGLYGSWHGHELTKAENVSYFMFSRFTWGVGLAMMVFACHNGYGWVINDFLSMKMWIPLSRLTYTAYLVHPIVLTVIFVSIQEPFTYTDFTLAVYAVAMVALSFGAAGVVAVFVEFPLSNLEIATFKAVGLKPRESTRHVSVERDVKLPQTPPEGQLSDDKNSNIQK